MNTLTDTLTEHEIGLEVEPIQDAAILAAARERKQATVPGTGQRTSVRAWSFSGRID